MPSSSLIYSISSSIMYSNCIEAAAKFYCDIAVFMLSHCGAVKLVPIFQVIFKYNFYIILVPII